MPKGNKRQNQNQQRYSAQEAEQVNENIVDEDQRQPQSEQQGEDLQQHQQQDYREIGELDRYEDQGVDHQSIEDNPEARRRAQRQLDRKKSRQMEQADEMEEYFEEEQNLERMIAENRRVLYADDDEVEVDQRRFLDAEEVKGKLVQWIKQDEVKKYIKQKFTKFIDQWKGTMDYAIYRTKIRQMCINNKQSIQISYQDLKQSLPTIAMWVGLQPQLILPELNSIAYYIACRYYPSYKNMFVEVFVKIQKLPIMDFIRDLRYSHLGKLIKVKGVITIRSEVFNQLKKIIYKCGKCGFPKGPFFINNVNDIKYGPCTSCQSSGPFFTDKQKTIYRNYQKITVQESTTEVLPGRIPRQKQVILLGDNIDAARPGQQVQITGTYINRYQCALNIKQGFPLFSTIIVANLIEKYGEAELKNIDTMKENEFQKISKMQNLDQIIYDSIAPSIYGHNVVKRALTLAMFGGVAKEAETNHKIRGDINVLLLGDPGVAKSQFLKSVQKVFNRCVYTTGKGASAVGLTASVRKDFSTNQWKLQAGALVLADKGVCLIDEFDKMNEHDRTSIHEAMQQQSISISKAGIVTTLRARCSVIAAANPIKGTYDPQMSFIENVDLSDPILSRFDIMCVIKDDINEDMDHHLSTFVLNSHMKNHPYMKEYDIEESKLGQREQLNKKQLIDHEILKHYIKYARQKCKPQLSNQSMDTIKQFFIKLREESKVTGGMNVTIRQIQSICRIATAHAKMRLRNEVKRDDIEVGIRTMLQSFIQTQKNSVAKKVKKDFAMYL